MPFLPEASTKYWNSVRPRSPEDRFHDAATGFSLSDMLKCSSVTWVSSITRTPQEVACRMRSSSNSARTYEKFILTRGGVESIKTIRTTFHAPLLGSRERKSVSAGIGSHLTRMTSNADVLTSFAFVLIQLHSCTRLRYTIRLLNARTWHRKQTLNANPYDLTTSSAPMKRKNGPTDGSMLSPTWYLHSMLDPSSVTHTGDKTTNLGNLAASSKTTSKSSRASAAAA